MGYLAIDFGGTRMRAAWFDEALALSNRVEIRTNVVEGQEAVVNRLLALAHEVAPVGESIDAIGVAAPGPMDAASGTIYHARTLPGWRDLALADLIERELGALTVMENDANLGALAEYTVGAGQGASPLIYLTISTGIGGGLVIDGEIFKGYGGLAFEPGHMLMQTPHGILRLEELASGTALGDVARRELAAGDQDSMLRTRQVIDGAAVGDAARAGDPLAASVVRNAGVWLGMGLVNLTHILNPQAIIIGGGVADLGELVFAPAREILHNHVLSPRFLVDDFIRRPALGEDLCLVGAAHYARQRSQNH